MAFPDMPFPEKILRNMTTSRSNEILLSQFGKGYAQAAKLGLNSSTRRTVLQMGPFDTTDKETLENFLVERGAALPFYIFPCNWTQKMKVRMDKDSYAESLVTKSKYLINFSVTEVFDLEI